MKIFLIRHGDTVYPYDNQGRKLLYGPDASLSLLGIEQIHQLSGEFKKQAINLDAIYMSPYVRAEQTAHVLSSALGIAHTSVMDDLKDVFPCSPVGKPYDELVATGGDIYAQPVGGDPQETLDHLVERGRLAMDSILKNAVSERYSSIGVVSHGDLISAIDWGLKNSARPLSYKEMEAAFYIGKAEACEYTIGSDLRLQGEGRIITTEDAKQTIEGFRNSPRAEQGQ